MPLAETASPEWTAAISTVHRIPSKRKLDDGGPCDEETSDLVSVRMRKDEPDAVDSSGDVVGLCRTNMESDLGFRVSNSRTIPCSSNPKKLQFFVRMISTGNTVVVHADSDDTVESVHEQILRITGIPVMEQRLIYRGKQLQWDRSLAECGVQNDAGLQLVGRMRSTEFPRSWQVVNDMVSSIYRLCKGDTQGNFPSRRVKSRVKDFLKEFLRMTSNYDNEMLRGHFQIFNNAGAPSALVMLFLSPIKGNKECAEEAIRLFLPPKLGNLPKFIQTQCAPIVLEFCKLLFITAHCDPLYVLCRDTLGSLLESIGLVRGSRYFDHMKAATVIREFFPFVGELAGRLSVSLDVTMKASSCTVMPDSDVRDFTAFLLPLCRAIEDRMGGKSPIPVALSGEGDKCRLYKDEIGSLHAIFVELVDKIDQCLKKVEDFLIVKGDVESESHQSGWSQYLIILKELNGVSKLYEGAEEKFRSILRSRCISLNAIVVHTKRTDDHRWLLEHKEVTNFQSRRHLVMMMFPELKDEYEELHEMLIDRSQLLAESFEYIAHADPNALHGGLFMEFKNEEATGPGVLREWFCLVCQAIFNRQNALFLACPNDRRRFYPNPASDVDPLHLEYFGFCGRVIALALMHKVQVGIAFDRVFFLQLSGKLVSLEDVRDADPCFYMSCKKILEMDANLLDSDALGLTFVREMEELGTLRVVELCPGGKNIVVNSRNRQEYVNLLIQNRFVTSISEQVSHFAQGFADILCNSKLHEFFFQSLELEDLDLMLYGSDREICVKDWKAHTEYNGYKETDQQICWFWKVVDGMSAEQRRILLFFWTSVKHLPLEGFGGLASKLYIYNALDSTDRLPSSHTCFYRLCLPSYPSLSIMNDRLHLITQEHMGYSFGTW